MNLFQLIEIAQKVFNNQDSPDGKQDKRIAEAVVAAAAALKEVYPQRKDS